MQCFKSAQTQDFTDANIRRILSYIADEKIKCEEKLMRIKQVQREIELVFQDQSNISLQDLQNDASLWSAIQSILGSDHWSINQGFP